MSNLTTWPVMDFVDRFQAGFQPGLRSCPSEECDVKFVGQELASYRRPDDAPVEIHFQDMQGRQDDDPRSNREPGAGDFQRSSG